MERRRWASARATLIGSSVTGSFVAPIGPANYFDPANGFVPAGYSNTAGTPVTVQEPPVEFGFNSGTDLHTANFTISQLLIEDQSLTAGTAQSNTMTFTDSAFAGLVVTPIVNTFPLAPTATLIGTTLSLSYPAETLDANTLYLSLFNFTPATAAPEPTSLTIAGAACLAGLARLRQTR